MTSRGFIALQVHSTKEKEPMEIRWKNIRLQDLDRAFPVARSEKEQRTGE